MMRNERQEQKARLALRLAGYEIEDYLMEDGKVTTWRYTCPGDPMRFAFRSHVNAHKVLELGFTYEQISFMCFGRKSQR